MARNWQNQWARLSQNWRRQKPVPGHIVHVGTLPSPCTKSQPGTLHVSSNQDIIWDGHDLYFLPFQKAGKLFSLLPAE